MQLTRLTSDDRFAVEISGINVLDCIGNQHLSTRIVDLLHEHLVLVFRDQNLSPGQLHDFSSLFGPLEPCPDLRFALPGFSDILVVGKIHGTSKSQEALFTNGGIEWHYDYAQTSNPALASILYAEIVPPAGGDTLYADTRAAFKALPSKTQEMLKSASAVYSYQKLNSLLDNADPTRISGAAPIISPVEHPIVQFHPNTGEPAILIAPEIMTPKEGIQESTIREILSYCTEDQFVYRHRWQRHDLVMHDNRATIHSATEMDPIHQRVMYRTTIMPRSRRVG